MENSLDTAPCYYFSFNDSGELVALNQTICTSLGYAKDELTGRKVESIFPISTRIFYQTHFFPLLKMHGHAEEIFISLMAKNGVQVPVLMNASREEKDGTVYNKCVCIVVQNRKKFEDELVSSRRIAESALIENAELKKVKEQLIIQAESLDDHLQLLNKQNNKLKQINRVTTHDLQESLRKILIFAYLTDEKTTRDSVQKFELQKLLKAANAMQDTLTGLQEFVWLNEAAIQPSEVDLNLVMVAVKKQLADELNVDMLDIFYENLPVITADNNQVCLLFYHLLNNAVQYRKPGQKAQVSVTAGPSKRNRFTEITERYKYDEFLKILVKDEGIGFEPQYKNHVFELFKKLHHLERRGLGLSFCKLIVENHGGIIEADSIPLKGTSISIFFPAQICSESNKNSPEN